MLRHFPPIAVALFVAAQLSAQEKLSPLFDMLATNSRINRPSVFRELQSSIVSNYEDLTPGLRADILIELSQQVRDKVLGRLRELRLRRRDTDLELVSDTTPIASIGFVNVKATAVIENTRTHAVTALSALMKDATDGLDQSVVNSISYALLNGMKELGIRNDLGGGGDVTQPEKLRRALANSIVDMAMRELRERVPVRELSDSTRTILFADSVVAAFNVGKQRLADHVVSIFDRTEHVLDKMTSELNDFLISGNSGLAITRAKGDVGGGIHVSYGLASWLQIGLYANAQIDPPDSAQPGPFFGGFQLRASIVDTEVSAFLSRYYGAADTSRMDGAATEIGLGVTQNFGPFIVGAAVLYQWHALLSDSLGNAKSVGKISTGIQLRVPDRSAPVFTIGWGWDAERGLSDGGPIVQVGVPLVSED